MSDATEILDSHWMRKQLVQAEQTNAQVSILMVGAMVIGRVEKVNGLDRVVVRSDHTSTRWFVPIGSILALGVG